MNFRTFYETTGVDYDALLQRMMGKEALIEKYIGIFLSDSTYAELAQAMAASDYEAVGMKAHTLKGIAANLNLEKLCSLCAVMVGSVKSDNTQELETQFENVKAEYEYIINKLSN